jgi:hypothetical protein
VSSRTGLPAIVQIPFDAALLGAVRGDRARTGRGELGHPLGQHA